MTDKIREFVYFSFINRNEGKLKGQLFKRLK